MIRNMGWHRTWVSLRLCAVVLLAIVIVAPEWPAFGDPRFRLRAIVGQENQFDFLIWTVNALGVKVEALLADIQSFLPHEVESAFVVGYLQQVRAAQVLEAEIERIYADPAVANPAQAAAAKQAEVDAIRSELAIRQPLAEAIVQRQVASLLREEGLTIGGVTFPPVLMTMSPVPYMLIVSPRDRIEQADYAALVPGLATDVKEGMESAVFDELDMSALVVPIGGLGIYPAMIRETSNINWLAEVTAHEWAHHWLSLRPLGVRYLDSPALRTINETVASLVDVEIGSQVIERYYPELVPPEPPGTPLPARPGTPADLPTFDFAAEMAETRDEVDRLLAEGRIEEAETYMEARRELFVSHGYAIRKLNQAYFAFYGGYAAEPGGAAGADPIGPMLRRIRAESPSLRVFLESVSRVTRLEDLLVLYEEIVGEDPAALLQ
jgi:hypothetical protein